MAAILKIQNGGQRAVKKKVQHRPGAKLVLFFPKTYSKPHFIVCKCTHMLIFYQIIKLISLIILSNHN